MRHEQGQLLADLGGLQVDLEGLNLFLQHGDLLFLRGALGRRATPGLGFQGVHGGLERLAAEQAEA